MGWTCKSVDGMEIPAVVRSALIHDLILQGFLEVCIEILNESLIHGHSHRVKSLVYCLPQIH